MEIIISEDALNWFQQEMETVNGETVRFFVRYGGSSKLQPGFSLGVTKDEPLEATVQTTHDGVLFFIEQSDVWYFDGHNLLVSVNDELNELAYDYEKAGN
ncbi:HesB/YadR/YfhF family protein [Planococcus sp. YIM B11945]|uniref:HesB/YadR/YfhF family protein n=1 Tax=Planococcus sp. YIM B11945 TaxID=3435410 RepID=UPI003D7C90A6